MGRYVARLYAAVCDIPLTNQLQLQHSSESADPVLGILAHNHDSCWFSLLGDTFCIVVLYENPYLAAQLRHGE